MAVSAETQLLIEQTAYRVAEEVCDRYAKAQQTQIELHAASCPGRSVGKATLAIVAAIATAAGAALGGTIAGMFRLK
jgi:dihydroneopterin aldolase